MDSPGQPGSVVHLPGLGPVSEEAGPEAVEAACRLARATAPYQQDGGVGLQVDHCMLMVRHAEREINLHLHVLQKTEVSYLVSK